MPISFRFAFLFLVAASAATNASAGQLRERIEIDGPVQAEVLRVVDGDTLLVAARPWPQQTMEVYVRLKGIDAPEIRSSCPAIREAGRAARQALMEMTETNRQIRLMHIAGDKYFGRVVADVELHDGRDPAQEMLAGGHVSPYDGGSKRKVACAAR